MVEESDQEENNIEKVSMLNTIFEDLVTDASDLVKDLYWSVKTYMFFGLNNNPFWSPRNRLQHRPAARTPLCSIADWRSFAV